VLADVRASDPGGWKVAAQRVGKPDADQRILFGYDLGDTASPPKTAVTIMPVDHEVHVESVRWSRVSTS
jgi:hypothetical protein